MTSERGPSRALCSYACRYIPAGRPELIAAPEKKLDYLPVPWMPSGLTTLSVPPMPLTWTAAEAMAGAATATSVILASALHG